MTAVRSLRLVAADGELVPPGDGCPCGVVWLTRPDTAVPATDGWLSCAESDRAAAMTVPARVAGWRLRRWTAKEALGEVLGPALGWRCDIEIANDADGAPQARWCGERLPFALSLTDRAGWAACALAPARIVVGCDLELLEPRSRLFVSDWFTPAEQAIVAGAADPVLAANLVWSAKESALKVLRAGLRRPTRSVEVRVDPDAVGVVFEPLVVSLGEGGELAGWWRRLGPYVFTVAHRGGEPVGPPTFLGGPVPG